MRFYVGTGLERAADADRVADALIAAGHEQTYRWSKHGSVQNEPERWGKVAWDEAQGVTTADVVIILLPGGRGTHVELGLAVGSGKPTIIVGDQVDPSGRTCIFYHHDMVIRIPYDLTDDERTIAAILEYMR